MSGPALASILAGSRFRSMRATLQNRFRGMTKPVIHARGARARSRRGRRRARPVMTARSRSRVRRNRPATDRPPALGYAGSMSFSPEDLALLDGAEEIEIETQAPDAEARRTVIWVVVDEDNVFVRTYKGPNSRWYLDATANPAVAIHVDGRRLPATAIPATDPDSIERTSSGFRRKYSDDGAMPAMVAPDVLETTLRLEPA
jgi:hypothetical protein